ncbi:SIS domain-containing protein [Candidatus Woesebacteria bacterium]|nr:SIS domain-containing protein [Candidatus Woesebacteria bacterium]
MPSILDSRDQIKKIDKSNLLGSVEALSQQIEDALSQTKSIQVDDSYKTGIKNVVVAGMGGSVLASYIIKNLYKSELQIPFEVVSHYELPSYVSEYSLVILSSYSGTTEEVLAAAEQAIAKKAKIMAIASGGPLLDLAKKHNWPTYKIEPNFNPSKQPRLAIGYAVVGQLMLLSHAGLLPDLSSELKVVTDNLAKMVRELSPETPDNVAKTLAFSCYDKHIILVGAEHLIGAAHVFNNQINENAKALTSEWHLPEFNHHYMEALSFPKLAKETTVFFFFNSALYHERVQKRVLLTKNLVEQKGYETQIFLATSKTKLEQVFEVIQLGEFVAAYIPVLYGIDPSSIPNVDWFKSEMSK